MTTKNKKEISSMEIVKNEVARIFEMNALFTNRL